MPGLIRIDFTDVISAKGRTVGVAGNATRRTIEIEDRDPRMLDPTTIGNKTIGNKRR